MTRSNVTVRRQGNAIPADDFYFTDRTTTRRAVSSTLTSTGASGSVLVLDSPSPNLHDGVGNEPPSCTWPAARAVTIPGGVFVQDKRARTAAGAHCP